MDSPFQEEIAATLADLSLPTPTNLIQTMLMKDGYFVGWKFRYDGGYAVLLSDSGTMELFDERGTVLKTVERQGPSFTSGRRKFDQRGRIGWP